MKSHKLSFIVLIFVTVLMITFCTEDSTSPPEEELNDITNPPGGYIIKLAINSQGDFFAATATGLFCSTNKGSKWNTVYINFGITDLLVTTSDVLFISYFSFDSSTLLRSFDNGNSWESLPSPRLNSSLYESEGGNIYSYGEDGLYKSTDLGDTWEVFYDMHTSNVLIHNDSIIIIGIPGEFIGQIIYSTDNGISWDSTGYNINVLAFYEYDSLIFVGGSFGDEGGGGVHKSTDDGLNWESCGLNQTSVSSFVTNKQNKSFIGTSEGIYFTEDEGATWQNILTDSVVTTLMKDEKGFLYAGTIYGTFIRSTDNGMTWHN